MRNWCLVTLALLVGGGAAGAQKSGTPGAPETFNASASVAKAGAGALAASITIHVEKYTSDTDRARVESALKTGGYPAFLTALRAAPEVGYVQIGQQKTAIRWARETAVPKGRTIVVVTDKPVFFVGGGAPDAKPREGYEVAVIELNVGDIGVGSGRMAAAARVKPGGEAGVQIDDYADEPIKLVSVSRKLS